MISSYQLAPDLVVTYQGAQPLLHIPSRLLRVKVDWKVIAVISMFATQSTETSEAIDFLPQRVVDDITKKLIETYVLIPIKIMN